LFVVGLEKLKKGFPAFPVGWVSPVWGEGGKGPKKGWVFPNPGSWFRFPGSKVRSKTKTGAQGSVWCGKGSRLKGKGLVG